MAVLIGSSTLFFNPAHADVWRVNNTPGVNAHFTDLDDAVASANVKNGDTLYVELSNSNYSNVTLTKRLVIIGSGYLLNENTGLHANAGQVHISSLGFDSLASGTTVIGISASFRFNSNVDDITITRCTGSLFARNSYANSKVSNMVINKSYISIDLLTYTVENPQITNCLLTALSLQNTINGLVRNNTFILTAQLRISNSYLSNNLLLTGSLNAVNCTMKNNISTGNHFPAGNNNQNNVPIASLIVNTGTTEGRYRLAPGSPAIGAGETIGGVTPDVGMYGTADPYIPGGIPPIPTIYALTVAASVPATATTLDITFSTRSNN